MKETECNAFQWTEIQWDVKVSSFKQRADSGMVKAKSVCRRKKAPDRATKKYPKFYRARYVQVFNS